MVKISDDLCTFFHAELSAQRGGRYIIEVPKQEIDVGPLEPGENYEVALLANDTNTDSGDMDEKRIANEADSGWSPQSQSESPPVSEGERREVEIESTGDKGDGIAKVGPGFVIIVQDGSIGEEVEVEIEEVRDSFAYASIVEDHPSEP